MVLKLLVWSRALLSIQRAWLLSLFGTNIKNQTRVMIVMYRQALRFRKVIGESPLNYVGKNVGSKADLS
jgi:hypothetical protein